MLNIVFYKIKIERVFKISIIISNRITTMQYNKRSRRLENYLHEECNFNVLTNPEHMNKVDMSSTPEPIVKLFYQSGKGEYPEDQEAYFQPPKQDEFALAVYNFCKENAVDKSKFAEDLKLAWIQRCKKLWASAIRDVHFAFLMMEEQEETKLFDDVWFSVKKDVEEGADLVIEYNNRIYHINLFVDSFKSRKFFNRKKNYRQDSKKEIDLEVPMTFNGPKKSITNKGDDIWLYCDKHIEAVKRVITNPSVTNIEEYGDTLCKVSQTSISKIQKLNTDNVKAD